MLRYLLVNGETVLTPQGKQVVYGKVVLRNEKGDEYRKFPRGQAVLTNKRLLFLSCEHMQSMDEKNLVYSLVTDSDCCIL